MSQKEVLPTGVSDLFHSDCCADLSATNIEGNNDAFDALATVASYLPSISCKPSEKPNDTTFFEPISIEKIGHYIARTALPPEADTMKDYASVLISTPTIFPSVTQRGDFFWSDTLDSCLNDCAATHSNVFTSRMPMILPSGGQSVFTSVGRTVEQWVEDFCKSIDTSITSNRFGTAQHPM